jgi:hydroxymethylpyrimidine pyrophosphatase-like HAD family hydrolase
MSKEKARDNALHERTRIKCLFLDYDGTIGPLNVPREKSQVSNEMLSTLEQISQLIPIVIVSTKDLPFLVPRTPFAHAWCGIAGLEEKIGNKVEQSPHLEDALEHVASALDYAKSTVKDAGMFLEEKHGSRGRTIAFCVDWRHAKDMETARLQTNLIKNRCIDLGLDVPNYAAQPFFDVYPVPVDKGKAVRGVQEKLRLEDGTLYMGDSEIDNPAFHACNVSLGVINEETHPQNLACDFFVTYGEVAEFLAMLLANGLFFDSSFPMVKTNPSRMGES